jgi:hypothetical protein
MWFILSIENIYYSVYTEYGYAVKREKRIWVLVVFDGEGLVSTNEAFAFAGHWNLNLTFPEGLSYPCKNAGSPVIRCILLVNIDLW